MLRPILSLSIQSSTIYKMNESISWDPSLIKKFSSSNYFKLLNQLRNEVKKYPLKNKKHIETNQTINSNLDIKNKTNTSNTPNNTFDIKPNDMVKENIDNSSVSFNNAKNFSIYNNTSNSYNSDKNHRSSTDHENKNQDSYSPTFKDRLNKIDMK